VAAAVCETIPRHSMKRKWTLVTALALACSSCQGLTGSDDTPPVVPSTHAAPERRAVDPEIEKWFRDLSPSSGVRLMAGDKIRIDVQGKPDLTVTRDVPLDGLVPIFETEKSVKALGATPQELEKEIAKAYTERFEKPPYVTVTIVTAAPRTIYLVGAVKNPGQYVVSGSDQLTVLKAIAIAGGFLPQSDLGAVTVQRIHPDRGVSMTSPPLDIRRVIEGGEQRDNLVVTPGDTIVVPGLQETLVHVMGHVEKQGSVAWHKGMRLSEAITGGGGFKRFAKTSRIKIVRHGTETIVVDFDEVIAGRVPDPELEPSDVVYVDERWI
jgi:protein involved in polysaccharide export with SLBB domain